jgi:hypothetical protein
MQFSDLQISKTNWHAGLTEANHLRNFFLLEPEMASQVVTRVYNRQNGYKNALSFLTGGLGKAKEMNDIIYRWSVMGDSRKAIGITRSVFDHVSGTAGIAGTTFKVGVSEVWFALGDVLVPDDARYSLRVMSEPVDDGVDIILTCQLVTNDQTDFIPDALLTVGSELSKDYNSVENDGSETSGSTHYATPTLLENYMGTFRKEYSITGAVHDKVLTIKLVDPEGNETADTWVKYAEWEFWCQWMDEIEIALMYGKSNIKSDGTTNMKGATGRVVYTSAGLEEQISASNKRFYTELTESTIREFMNDLAFNGTEDGPREYVALCGRNFMDLFDQAMKVSAGAYTLTDTKFITGSGQELTLGGQFMTYVGLNGDKFTLKEYAPYNSTVRNRLKHPLTGRPAESYKATFLNFKSYSSGEPNIQKVYTKGREMVTTYIEGMYGPTGPKKNGSSATAKDGYDFIAMSECGIMLKNPTDAAQLILDVDGL